MPLRLLGIIFIFVILLVFIGFNLGNSCDISFGFKTLPDVPVFYTIFVSFILGVLITLPLALRARSRHRDAPPKEKKKFKLFKKKNDPGEIAKEFDEPPPSYSGGKYFDKDKFKKEK